MNREGTQRVLIEFQIPGGESDVTAVVDQLLPVGVVLDPYYAPVTIRTLTRCSRSSGGDRGFTTGMEARMCG